jgi:hypothetical protein
MSPVYHGGAHKSTRAKRGPLVEIVGLVNVFIRLQKPVSRLQDKIRIVNKVCKNVAKFKTFGLIVTNQNCVQV